MELLAVGVACFLLGIFFTLGALALIVRIMVGRHPMLGTLLKGGASPSASWR